jgi:hypothetical protein
MAIYISSPSPGMLSPTPDDSMIKPVSILKLFSDLYSLICGKLFVPPAEDNLYNNLSCVPDHSAYDDQKSSILYLHSSYSFRKNYLLSDFYSLLNIRSAIHSLRAGGREASWKGYKPPPRSVPTGGCAALAITKYPGRTRVASAGSNIRSSSPRRFLHDYQYLHPVIIRSSLISQEQILFFSCKFGLCIHFVLASAHDDIGEPCAMSQPRGCDQPSFSRFLGSFPWDCSIFFVGVLVEMSILFLGSVSAHFAISACTVPAGTRVVNFSVLPVLGEKLSVIIRSHPTT